MGDVVITLPYVHGFAKQHAEVEIHFLTRKEESLILGGFSFIHKSWAVKGGRNPKLTLLRVALMLPALLFQRFDVVCDFQNNIYSKLIRKVLRPKAWVEFDRWSLFPAGERTFETINFLKLKNFVPLYKRDNVAAKNADHFYSSVDNDWLKVVINPAGFFESRNWPFEYYIQWARLLKEAFKGKVIFVFIGVDRIADFTRKFIEQFPQNTLSFVNKTSQSEAFGLLQHADFMLTEDSGLMHMSWVSGVPTLAIFGSSRSDWSRPLGAHSKLLSSDDLECGNCLEPKCKFGDNRCLTRYTPQIVFRETLELLNAK